MPDEPQTPTVTPFDLAEDDVSKVYAAQKTERDQAAYRRKFFEGKYGVRSYVEVTLENGEKVTPDLINPDGSRKAEVIDNKIAEMIERHVGYALANGVEIAPRDDTDSGKAMQKFYNEVAEANDLDSVNAEILEECFIENFGVEVHSFDDQLEGAARIQITHTPAREWTLVWDMDGKLRAAIRVYCIGPYIFDDDGQLITKSWRVSVYTDKVIRNYEAKAKEGDGLAIDSLNKLQEIPHNYGMVPVAWFSISENFDDYITDAMIMLQRHYNELLSDNGNAINQSAGKLVVVKGYAKTKENEKAVGEAKQKGLLMVDKDGGVESIEFGVGADRIGWQEEKIRSALFAAGKMTDTARIVGANSAASGIALELLSVPQRDFSLTALQYFAEGIRRRVALINAVQGKFEGAVIIENYEVKIKPSAARLTGEILQYLPSMENTVSRLDRLRMLAGLVQDPEAANERFEKERGALAMNTKATQAFANPAQAVANQQQQIAQAAPTTAQLSTQLEQGLSDIITNTLFKSGAIDRRIAQGNGNG